MAIRLRMVGDTLVALCAARSVEKPGDVYLDDGQHYALDEKFWNDYPKCGIEPAREIVALIDAEESNNANRMEWDATFGTHQGAETR